MTAESPATESGNWKSTDATDGSHERILQGSETLLLQGETLLRGVTAEQYSAHVPMALGGSIGTHYRHCLDHFAIIAIFGRLQGIELPKEFGMAPSTLAHLRRKAP